MNNSTAVIKINPSELTIGSINSTNAKSLGIIRSNVYAEGFSIAKAKSAPLLRAFFGNTSRPDAQSQTIMICRMLFGIGLALFGFIEGSMLGQAYCPLAIFAVIAGVMMIPGMATRLCMALTICIFGYISLNMAFSGDFPGFEILFSLGGIMLVLTGPGKYSADANLKKKIFKTYRRYETRRLMERRFSYKAHLYANL